MSQYEKLHQSQSVLCIYPWEKGVSVTNWFPLIGLECIAASIENAGISTHTVDMRFEFHSDPLGAFPAETVCISVNWEDQIPVLPYLLENFTPDQCIIVGGRAATSRSNNFQH
jgi:hypothetical protein